MNYLEENSMMAATWVICPGQRFWQPNCILFRAKEAFSEAGDGVL
jgi:hypothetical protein